MIKDLIIRKYYTENSQYDHDIMEMYEMEADIVINRLIYLLEKLGIHHE